MARSKPSWVLSMRVTGTDRALREGNASSVPGLCGDPHPWESPPLSALARGALARAVDELGAGRLRRVRVHRRAAAHEPAHVRSGGVEVLFEKGRDAPLQLSGSLQVLARLERRHGRKLGHDRAALLPQPRKPLERTGAHERQLAFGQLYETAVTGVHACPATWSQASRS